MSSKSFEEKKKSTFNKQNKFSKILLVLQLQMYNYIGFHIRKLLLSGLYNRKSGKIHSLKRLRK